MQIERLKDFSENIVESLNVGVLAVDLEDRIESWNTRWKQSVRRAAAGRGGQTPAGSAACGSGRGNCRARGRRPDFRNLQTPAATRAREASWWSTFPSLRWSARIGERIGRLILFDDVTQRVRLEEQMVQTEKLTSLGLLAAGVAHEVNTPLAVISNYIQMLAKQMPADDPRQKMIEKIVKQTFRASEIVNNLAEFFAHRRSGSSWKWT